MHNLDQICIRNKITNWVDTMCVPQNVDIYGFVKSRTKKVESFCYIQTNIDDVVWERGIVRTYSIGTNLTLKVGSVPMETTQCIISGSHVA